MKIGEKLNYDLFYNMNYIIRRLYDLNNIDGHGTENTFDESP